MDIRMDGLQSYSDKKSPHELCDNPLAVLVTECAKARFPGQNFLEIQAPYAKKIEKRYDNYTAAPDFVYFLQELMKEATISENSERKLSSSFDKAQAGNLAFIPHGNIDRERLQCFD